LIKGRSTSGSTNPSSTRSSTAYPHSPSPCFPVLPRPLRRPTTPQGVDRAVDPAQVSSGDLPAPLSWALTLHSSPAFDLRPCASLALAVDIMKATSAPGGTHAYCVTPALVLMLLGTTSPLPGVVQPSPPPLGRRGKLTSFAMIFCAPSTSPPTSRSDGRQPGRSWQPASPLHSSPPPSPPRASSCLSYGSSAPSHDSISPFPRGAYTRPTRPRVPPPRRCPPLPLWPARPPGRVEPAP